MTAEPLPTPDSRDATAELAAIQRGCSELSIFLQRLAAAIATGQVGDLAHDVSEGVSVAREKQLPSIFVQVDAEVGRLRALASRHAGRLLAAREQAHAADVAYRRRQATRLQPRYGPVDSLSGHVTVLGDGAAGEDA